MKLLTTITALAHPDADDPFKTEVWYQGVIEQDTLKGDLYVVGGYDPEFDDEALDSLVNAVSRFPFSVISGHVVWRCFYERLHLLGKWLGMMIRLPHTNPISHR